MKKSTFFAILVIAMCIAFGFITSCKTNAYPNNKAYMNDTLKWNQFLECSKDEGDLGCDSCFYLVYGYYLNDAYETYR
jgi:hypothetical protein